MFSRIDTNIDFFLSFSSLHNKLTLPCKFGFETPLTIRVECLESDTAFSLVIGLSIEEPRIHRTAVKEGFGCSQSLGLTLPENRVYYPYNRIQLTVKSVTFFAKQKSAPLFTSADAGVICYQRC